MGRNPILFIRRRRNRENRSANVMHDLFETVEQTVRRLQQSRVSWDDSQRNTNFRKQYFRSSCYGKFRVNIPEITGDLRPFKLVDSPRHYYIRG